jgi:nucleoid DNA-binding protein
MDREEQNPMMPDKLERGASQAVGSSIKVMTNHAPRGFPLATCSACGGDWFREATYYAFLSEKGLYIWPGWPDLVGQDSLAPMTVGICLCGTPLDPSIRGVRAGPTPAMELSRFLGDLETAKKSRQDRYDADSVARVAEGALARTEALQSIEERLKGLQRELGRRARSGPGRYWELPTREAGSGENGTLTRDGLALELQECNLSFREARQVVDTIFQCMTKSLQRGEEVNVEPLGAFAVVDCPETRKRFRLQKLQTLYRQSRKVVFRPAHNLQLLLAQWGRFIQREVEMPKDVEPHIRCEKCGGTSFTEEHFRQYWKKPTSLPGDT